MRHTILPHTLHFSTPRMAVFGRVKQRGLRFLFGPAKEDRTRTENGAGAADSELDRQRRLEAVLFLSPQGITSRKAAKLADLADATEVRTLIRQLNRIYDCQFKPYRIEEVAGGYALVTRGRLSPWLRKLSYLPGEVRLGRPALETLAIVAYRQPVMRADIEAIRGVASSELLKQLMEMDLVRISGRSEDLGRPYLYGTTPRFLQMFGLRSADRLPRIEWVNFVAPVDTITPSSEDLGSSSEDFVIDSEAKESTVKSTITAANFKGGEIVDELLLKASATLVPISAIDDDDDDWDDDEEEDEDDFEDDEEDDLDDWEDEEEEDLGEEEEAVDEAEDELEEEEEEEEWEEVDDDEEEEEGEESEEEEDDDWDDDDDDDDWDDDEEEEDWE